MAHEIDMSNGRANMAYVGETPWHGLGQELQAGADIDTWKREAGMEWELNETPVLFQPTPDGILAPDQGPLVMPGRKILYRSDTKVPLSVVSESYRVVQPGEILEFYRDLVGAAGFTLNTAGVLHGGKKFWALASLGENARLMGQDEMKGYLLLATSCDGTLATVAQFTSIRVVCQNTLNYSVGRSGEKARLRVPHQAKFNPDLVKAELGIAHESWEGFIERANLLTKTKLARSEAIDILATAMKLETIDQETGEELDLEATRGVLRDIMRLYDGEGRGAKLRSAKGTAWGLVNATTEYLDHHRKSRTVDARMDWAWFGEGATFKKAVWDAAMKVAA